MDSVLFYPFDIPRTISFRDFAHIAQVDGKSDGIKGTHFWKASREQGFYYFITADLTLLLLHCSTEF